MVRVFLSYTLSAQIWAKWLRSRGRSKPNFEQKPEPLVSRTRKFQGNADRTVIAECPISRCGRTTSISGSKPSPSLFSHAQGLVVRACGCQTKAEEL